VTYNLSELFERVVDVARERTAVVVADRRVTYGQLDERANRLAHHLAGQGVGAGDHVGLHLLNGNEYLEGMLAAFKLSAVPVNINYRYVERELEHLYRYMDLSALVVHRQFMSQVSAVVPGVETLRHVVVVDDGSKDEAPAGWVDYEAALAGASAERDFTGRTGDDIYCACTGGTTGLPKGVMWRHEDIFFASMGGGDPTMLQGPISDPNELPGRVPEIGLVQLITPPLMHVSAHWGAFMGLYGGATLVFPPPGAFDPSVVWPLVETEKANLIVLVGNAMATPMLDWYVDHPVDASSMFVLASGGAILSKSVKDRIRELLPNMIIIDGYGSTETGVAGTDSGTEGVFKMDPNTAVLDDDLAPVEPGSGQIGRLARKGRIPVGYYKDPDKTAATFVEKDGIRWVLPGDLASVEADGSITLHGRGSVTINTGGEKVFPEEVESALLSLDAIADVLVVGVPDDRWGQRVVAVAATRPGATLTLEGLQRHAREHLAGYKVPRDLVLVDTVVRGPNAKPDYGWARDQAIAATQ
jgi:acyl-CoA synthetase (AMP-forming)/AMP-acid ligase II